jgi:hypothetical protein
MFISQEIKDKLRDLSRVVRKIHGIREKEAVSYRKYPNFVNEVVRDFTNISYNLAIADHVNSEAEKELLLIAMERMFYADGNPKKRFMDSIGKEFDKFETSRPEIKSPIYMLERARIYDRQHKTKTAKIVREHLIAYAEALVMADGFQSVREFEVLETFRLWVMEER